MKGAVIIIQFPGVNCEYETARALEAAGALAAGAGRHSARCSSEGGGERR